MCVHILYSHIFNVVLQSPPLNCGSLNIYRPHTSSEIFSKRLHFLLRLVWAKRWLNLHKSITTLTVQHILCDAQKQPRKNQLLKEWCLRYLLTSLSIWSHCLNKQVQHSVSNMYPVFLLPVSTVAVSLDSWSSPMEFSSLTKLEGNSPDLPFNVPLHQPSSTCTQTTESENHLRRKQNICLF